MMEEQSMNEHLQTLMNYKGNGNPDGKYWFVGVEEAAEFGKWGNEELDEKIKPYKTEWGFLMNGDLRKIKEEFIRKNPKRRFTSVYNIIAKIVLGIENRDSSEMTSFLDNQLFTRDGSTFQMNLYPLGKPAEKNCPSEFEHLFGLKNSTHYMQEIKANNRFQSLRDFWIEHRPKVTICFGEAHWKDFKELFKIADAEIKETDKLQFCQSKGVVLAPFFKHFLMTTERINLLSDTARSWNS